VSWQGLHLNFTGVVFDGGDFSRARFSGGKVYFNDARFSGGKVDFSDVRDWSFPPAFPWTDTPPAGVKFPDASGT
jgi:hypothetical protein